MPAIRGIYYEHPQTGEAGLWIWLAWGGDKNIIGLSQKELDALKLTGNMDKQMASCKATVENTLTTACKHREPLIGWTSQELEAYATKPPPYCEVDVNMAELIVQPIVITITPLSLALPRRVQIEVSEGACKTLVAYG